MRTLWRDFLCVNRSVHSCTGAMLPGCCCSVWNANCITSFICKHGVLISLDRERHLLCNVTYVCKFIRNLIYLFICLIINLFFPMKWTHQMECFMYPLDTFPMCICETARRRFKMGAPSKKQSETVCHIQIWPIRFPRIPSVEPVGNSATLPIWWLSATHPGPTHSYHLFLLKTTLTDPVILWPTENKPAGKFKDESARFETENLTNSAQPTAWLASGLWWQMWINWL